MPRISVRSRDHASRDRSTENRLCTVGLLAACLLIGLAWTGGAAFGRGDAPGATPAARPLPADRSTAPSGDLSYADKILWHSEARREALFLPQAVLNETPLERLPLQGDAKRSVRWALGLESEEFNEHMQRTKEKVPAVPPEAGRRPSGKPVALHSLVEGPDLTFVGQVVAVSDGLHGVWGCAAEAVFIRVDQIIQDRRHQLRPGTVIAKVRTGGSIEVGGQEIRSERPNDQEDTRPGDQVLIGGNIARDDSGTLWDTFELVVREGVIQPSTSMNLTDELPKPLSRLLEEYQGDPLGEVYP